MELNNKRTVNAWCMYDWANSVYALVIKSSIFPVFFNTATLKAFDGEVVQFFGFEVINTALYSFSISFSFLVIAIISPFLSGIADYTGQKKLFMRIFTLIGSLSCMGLFFFTGHNVEWVIICAILASIGYTGSLVFYNAFLPEIVTPDRYDYVSAKGFSFGYVGSILLLVINLLLLSNPHWVGVADKSLIARFSFLSVGVWWLGFSQFSFSVLSEEKVNSFRESIKTNLTKGYKELSGVLKEVKQMNILKYYLGAFFFFSMGVQTIMYMAASFGSKELGLPGDKLVLTVLIINGVAIIGSYLFAYVSKVSGNKKSLLWMLSIWIFICLYAYFVYTAFQFYILAFIVGFVMGGIQSLARSTYSKLIPLKTKDHASYFSFYDVTEKLAVVIGTFSYGLIEQLTGSMRSSIVALGLFFAVGIGFLLIVKIPRFQLSKAN